MRPTKGWRACANSAASKLSAVIGERTEARWQRWWRARPAAASAAPSTVSMRPKRMSLVVSAFVDDGALLEEKHPRSDGGADVGETGADGILR